MARKSMQCKRESKSELDKFIGTWTSNVNDNITFYSNQTFSHGEYVNGTYSIKNGYLMLDTTDNTPGTHPDNP